MTWRNRLDVVVEVGARGVAAGEFQWDIGHWDVATWSGVEPTFVPLDLWEVEGFNVQRGRARGVDRNATGTAELTLVYPSPLAKWSFLPSSPVRVGEEMRVSVRPRGLDGHPLVSAPIPVFRGAARAIKDDWRPSKQGNMIFRLVISLSDRMGDLAAINLPERPVEGLDDLTHERIARIMRLANIPDFYLRHGPSVVRHNSSNFARNLLDEAQVAVESEGPGDFYVDRAGFYWVRERRSIGNYPRENEAQVRWSNMAGKPGIAPTAFGSGTALDDVVNQVAMARAGGEQIVVGGPLTDSALRFGLRTYQRFDLTCRDDADVQHAAQWRLDEQILRTQRIDSLQVEIDPRAPDADVLALSDIELGDKHYMAWTDGFTELEGHAHVQGIKHTISGTDWRITLNLWAYAGEGLFPAIPEFEAGRWDEGVWGTAKWGL